VIGLLLAFAIQAVPSDEPKPAPVLTAVDPCVELQGRGIAIIGQQRFRGRALARALAEQLSPGRPLFLRFANERAGSDVEGMATVMAAAADAPEVVIVETCELSAGDSAQ
jgi:hypothetical protein